MQFHLFLTTALGLMFLAGISHAGSEKIDPKLAAAVRKTVALDSYSFTIAENPGQGTSGAFQGTYQKGQPVAFTADKIDFLRQGNVLVYKDGGQWQRSKTGIQSDPLRILGGAAKVRGARLPHEELPELLKILQGGKQAEVELAGATVYAGTLDDAGARKLTPPATHNVARSGRAKIWVGADGRVHKYSLTIRVQGRLGNAEVDGQVTRTVTLGDFNSTRVAVPEGARKMLE